MSFIDEDLTFFSQKPQAHLQPKFECKLLGKIHQHFAGYITKMAAMPIYGKNPLKTIFPGTTWQILMKLCMKHQRPKPFIIPPVYEVYRGYIVFAFSVCVCVYLFFLFIQYFKRVTLLAIKPVYQVALYNNI